MAEKKGKEQEAFVDEKGSVYIEVVRDEVAKATKEVVSKMDEISEAQRKADEETTWLRDKLAEVEATATAAARASAVPLKKKEGWEPLPLDRYPKEWVEKYGTKHVAVRADFDEGGIMIAKFFIPLKPGKVIEVPGNVADVMAEIGLI